MLVKGWMTTEIITVDENMNITKAAAIMREHRFRTLPVLNHHGVLVGIVTDRDLKDFSTSKATDFYEYERGFIDASVRIRDIMTRDVVFVRPDETIELAALLMLKNKFSSLPVINSKQVLVGIITQTDIFKILVTMLGINQGGVQFAFSLEERSDAIAKVADYIHSSGGQIVSILATHESAEEERQNVYFRVVSLSHDKAKSLARAIDNDFFMLYSVCETTDDVNARYVRGLNANITWPHKSLHLSYVN